MEPFSSLLLPQEFDQVCFCFRILVFLLKLLECAGVVEHALVCLPPLLLIYCLFTAFLT